MNTRKTWLICGAVVAFVALVLTVGIVFGGALGDCDDDDRKEGDIDCILYWERKKDKPKPTVSVKPKPSVTEAPKPAVTVKPKVTTTRK